MKRVYYFFIFATGIMLSLAGCQQSSTTGSGETTAQSACSISSPSGDLQLTFSMDATRPQYELSYKGKPVILHSHLGLELARDKHASKGLNETDLMDG